MIYWLYTFCFSLFLLLAAPFVPLLLIRGERFRSGFWERLGVYPREVRDAMAAFRPIWLHAVSMGEVLSATRLATELKDRFPQRKILLSTFTATGRGIARQAKVGDAVIFFPLDHPWIIRRALSVFDPCMLIFLETEIWPNFLRLAHRKGIPTLLLSGRLSPRAFRHYAALRVFFSGVVRRFTAMGMQSAEDAERIVRLGAAPSKVSVTGSLKHVSFQGNGGRPQRSAQGLPGQRSGEASQILVAGSTHAGEEEILLEALQILKPRFPTLTIVLAPRHPQRFAEVEKLLQRSGLRYEKRSRMNGYVLASADVLFLDTVGELPDFYSIADVAFVGGSLVDAGGHNLIEPARFRKPVLFGPYMTNFAEITAEMKRAGGGIEIRDLEDLVREVGTLLADPLKARAVGDLAFDVVARDRDVVGRTMGLVSRYLQ